MSLVKKPQNWLEENESNLKIKKTQIEVHKINIQNFIEKFN